VADYHFFLDMHWVCLRPLMVSLSNHRSGVNRAHSIRQAYGERWYSR